MKKVQNLIFVAFLATSFLVGALVGPVVLAPSDEIRAAPMLSGEDGTRDTITVTDVINTGITHTLTLTASGDGNKFVNTGKTILFVNNGYTATITATIVTPGTVGGLAIADVVIPIAASTQFVAGPFVTGIFNQGSGTDRNRTYVNWNTVVTGTVADNVTVRVYEVD